MPDSKEFELRFDPKTIEHLGVKMYSTLPPALAELISNSYDADSGEVKLKFHEQNGSPVSIQIIDNGDGMTAEDIQERFLVIGRNRRKEDGDTRTKKYHRLPTGKKGLGKLALFGLAKTITITTRRLGKENKFELDWNSLIGSSGVYKPKTLRVDESTDLGDGTIIRLSNLKRTTPFDLDGLANSLSKIFIVDDDFRIVLESTDGERLVVDNKRRYSLLDKQFEWNVATLVKGGEYEDKISGSIYTGKTPISPSSGLRGVTLFSRGKMVNAPEYFSNSASSHFFQYLTGWLSVDFIDLIEEDVISTNRQAINWEQDDMSRLRKFISGIISHVNSDWRAKRKEEKNNELKDTTGIDTERWLSTLPEDVRKYTSQIVETLGGEDALQKYTPVIKALHEIIPEYPQLHWRHLHEQIRERIKSYYENKQYGNAADQGAKIYCEVIRGLTGLTIDGTDLTGKVFGGNPPQLKVADLTNETGQNIQKGQEALSRGLITGFRNPVSHAPIDSVVPNTFSELDCLNILSLISYLITRLDNADVTRDYSQ